jgi:hypothetical protein
VPPAAYIALDLRYQYTFTSTKGNFMTTKKFNTPDLTQRPPRSPRVRLGGYAILARCLDKGRATLAGKNGEYNYACPLDMNWFTFAGLKPAELKK